MSAEPKDGILGRVAKHFFTGVRSSGASNTGRAARTHTTTDVFSTTLFLRLPRLVFYRCCLSVALRLRTTCTPPSFQRSPWQRTSLLSPCCTCCPALQRIHTYCEGYTHCTRHLESFVVSSVLITLPRA